MVTCKRWNPVTCATQGGNFVAKNCHCYFKKGQKGYTARKPKTCKKWSDDKCGGPGMLNTNSCRCNGAKNKKSTRAPTAKKFKVFNERLVSFDDVRRFKGYGGVQGNAKLWNSLPYAA